MRRVVVAPDATSAGEAAADLIVQQWELNPRFVLGVATGSTPLGTWAALGRRGLDLGQVTAFALDEYLGLPPDHPQSYRVVVDREITRPLGLDPRRVHTPDSRGDAERSAARYEAAIAAAGGVDLQLLGIGRNGHIGFNEPGSSLVAPTHVARLTAETRQDNARFFGSLEEVPTRCITQGIGTILRARQLVLIALGSSKASAIAQALEGPVTPGSPASAVQRHPNVVVVLDRDAASLLDR